MLYSARVFLTATGIALISSSANVSAAPLEFRYGFDVFSQRTTSLHALQSLTMTYDLGSGFYIGETLFSAAGGDAGGLFTAGFEIAKRFKLGNGLDLEFGAFVGGGGGANVVTSGDGLMTRTHATLIKQITPNWAATLGLSYIKISGTSISTPALGFGISRTLDMKVGGGHDLSFGNSVTGDISIAALKPFVRVYYPRNNLKRSGVPLKNMYIVGAEMSFHNARTDRGETFLSAATAMAGDGAGYGEYQFGYRWFTGNTGARAFAQLAAGFAGGGGVDTGGGLIATAGIGAVVPISDRFSAEFGVTGIKSFQGDFAAISPYIRGAITLGKRSAPQGSNPTRWQISTGFAQQVEHTGYRVPASTRSGSPVLVETTIDLFFNDHLYFTGNAQSAVLGDAGAYAVGQIGVGYEIPISDRWTISPELYVGAAAGAGINTGGGLVAGGKLELDYSLRKNLKVSFGAGKMLSKGGAKPVSLHIGLKIPFTSYN